jgi:hypothetical protein
MSCSAACRRPEPGQNYREKEKEKEKKVETKGGDTDRCQASKTSRVQKVL